MLIHRDQKKEQSFILSLGLTSITFIFELVGGLLTGSLALISDSAHVFLDVFALGISYVALKFSSRPADDTHSYGFHRFEVLAALVNGLTLLIISGGIFYEAWKRWNNPTEIKTGGMLIIAVVGLIVNLVVARVLHGHQHTHDHSSEHAHDNGTENQDLNVRSAYLHVIGDAISSVGVILAAVVITFTGWTWLDPLMSAVIGVIIFTGSFRVLKSSLHILVEGVPEGIKLKDVNATLHGMEGIREVHDLHVWNICSGNIALSAHILLDDQIDQTNDEIIKNINQRLLTEFKINHTTLQIETSPCANSGC
jgi:cobalt-zinc-cadmium efflux system protein